MNVETPRFGLSAVEVLSRFAPDFIKSTPSPIAERLIERKYLVERKFKDGDRIVIEGEPGNAMYFLAEGRAVITRKVLNGLAPDEHVAFLDPGAVFGEMALIYEQLRNATVTAVGDVTVHELNRDGWIYIQEAYPKLGVAIKEVAKERKTLNESPA